MDSNKSKAFRKVLLATLMACTAITPLDAQKLGKAGGVGSTSSTYNAQGEPTGGTYSINGQTGAATLGPVTVNGPVTASGTVTASNISGSTSGVNTGDQTSVTGNAGTATKLTTPRSISITGDSNWTTTFDGSANVTATSTLATVNANTGTFGSTTAIPVITTDGKGRITSVSTVPVSSGSPTFKGLTDISPLTTTASSTELFGITTNSSNAISNLAYTKAISVSTGASSAGNVPLLNGSGVLDSSILGSVNASTAQTWSTARTVTATGDTTWSFVIDGSGNVSTATTLAAVNSTPGSYGAGLTIPTFTVNAKGLVTAAGSVALGTVPIGQGGTGSTTASAALTALGAQASSANLTALAGLSTTANNCGYWSGVSTAALYSCTTYGRSLVGATSAANAQSLLGVTATGADTTYNYRANNLSDVANAGTARTNLGAAASGANIDITSITGSAAKLTTARTISISGDVNGSTTFDGSANVTATVVMPNVNGSIGTFGAYGTGSTGSTLPIFTVDAKGRITAVSTYSLGSSSNYATGVSGNTVPLFTGNNSWSGTQSFNAQTYLAPATTSGSSVNIASATGIPSAPHVGDLWVTGTSNALLRYNDGTATHSLAYQDGSITGNAGTATTLQTARTITGNGDTTWSTSFDGSANVTATTTLATVNSNVGTFGNAGTYTVPIITVDGKGRTTAASSYALGSSATLSTATAGDNLSTTLATSSFSQNQTIQYPIFVAGGSTTLTAAQATSNNLNVYGALSSNQIVYFSATTAPFTRTYLITNNTTGAYTLGIAASSGSVNGTIYIAQGKSAWVIISGNSARVATADYATSPINVSSTDITGTLAATSFPGLTGDVTAAAGSLSTTLATVNSNVGTFGSATYTPVITTDAKGRITSISTVATSGGTGGTAANGIPSGGTTGQVLKKNSNADYDTSWLSLGTASSYNTGTSGATIGLLNGNNTYSGTTTFSNPITGSVTGSAGTANTLTTARSLAIVGDVTGTTSFDGSANVSTTATLATVNSNVGTFGSGSLIPVITTDAKGRITAVSTVAATGGTGSQNNWHLVSGASTYIVTDGDAVVFSNAGGSIAITLPATFPTGHEALLYMPNAVSLTSGGTTVATGPGLLKLISTDGTQNGIFPEMISDSSGNIATATKLATPRAIATTGDVTSSLSFDGSANVSTTATLATVNSNVGTYGSATTIPVITTDGKGRITAVSTVTASGGGGGAATSDQAYTPSSGSVTAAAGTRYSFAGTGTLTLPDAGSVGGQIITMALEPGNTGVTVNNTNSYQLRNSNASGTSVASFTYSTAGIYQFTSAAGSQYWNVSYTPSNAAAIPLTGAVGTILTKTSVAGSTGWVWSSPTGLKYTAAPATGTALTSSNMNIPYALGNSNYSYTLPNSSANINSNLTLFNPGNNTITFTPYSGDSITSSAGTASTSGQTVNAAGVYNLTPYYNGSVYTWQINFTPIAGATPPVGGTLGQVLTKNSGSSFDYSWATPTAGIAIVPYTPIFAAGTTAYSVPAWGRTVWNQSGTATNSATYTITGPTPADGNVFEFIVSTGGENLSLNLGAKYLQENAGLSASNTYLIGSYTTTRVRATYSSSLGFWQLVQSNMYLPTNSNPGQFLTADLGGASYWTNLPATNPSASYYPSFASGTATYNVYSTGRAIWNNPSATASTYTLNYNGSYNDGDVIDWLIDTNSENLSLNLGAKYQFDGSAQSVGNTLAVPASSYLHFRGYYSTTTNGWVLTKNIPGGGTAGQVLTKSSSTGGDYSWTTASGGSSSNYTVVNTAAYGTYTPAATGEKDIVTNTGVTLVLPTHPVAGIPFDIVPPTGGSSYVQITNSGGNATTYGFSTKTTFVSDGNYGYQRTQGVPSADGNYNKSSYGDLVVSDGNFGATTMKPAYLKAANSQSTNVVTPLLANNSYVFSAPYGNLTTALPSSSMNDTDSISITFDPAGTTNTLSVSNPNLSYPFLKADGTTSTSAYVINQAGTYRFVNMTIASGQQGYSVQYSPPSYMAIPKGGTTGQVLAKNTATNGDYSWTTASGGGATDVQVFDASGTWTKPAGAKTVEVIEIGGGASGNSAGAVASGTAIAGGNGGAPGQYVKFKVLATALGATVNITVGAGGATKAGTTTTTSSSNYGNAGGTSQFGSFYSASGGNAGGASAQSGGNTYLDTATSNGSSFAAGAGASGTYGGCGNNNNQMASGAAGSGLAASPTALAGACNGSRPFFSQASAAFANGAGQSGSPGVASTGDLTGGPSGSGGGSSTTGNGGAGGAGAVGAGGAGGGAALSGFTGGAGGAGGNGRVIVITES